MGKPGGPGIGVGILCSREAKMRVGKERVNVISLPRGIFRDHQLCKQEKKRKNNKAPSRGAGEQNFSKILSFHQSSAGVDVSDGQIISDPITRDQTGLVAGHVSIVHHQFGLAGKIGAIAM